MPRLPTLPPPAARPPPPPNPPAGKPPATPVRPGRAAAPGRAANRDEHRSPAATDPAAPPSTRMADHVTKDEDQKAQQQQRHYLSNHSRSIVGAEPGLRLPFRGVGRQDGDDPV